MPTLATPAEIPVPAAVGQLHLLDRVDYEDAFSLHTRVDRSPEQWMRAFLENAPRWFQVSWVSVGKVMMGARFGRFFGSPEHVLGWKILDDSPEAFAIGLDSSGGLMARLVALTPPGQAVIATQIRLDTRYARTVWPTIRRGHRYFAPYLLGRAAADGVADPARDFPVGAAIEFVSSDPMSHNLPTERRVTDTERQTAFATLRPVQSVFDAAGGQSGLLALADAWHVRVMADEVVSHAFSHGFDPEHTQRLAAYWAEALGGPATYTGTYGDETHVVRLHSGNGPHAEMDRRAIACFDQALADVGLNADDKLRQILHDYFTWATTHTMGRYHDSAQDVPDGLSIPRWSWGGLTDANSVA